MSKIVFHPFDIKQHGAHVGMVRASAVSLIEHESDTYDNDAPIKTCNVDRVGWVEELDSFVVLLDEDVVIEETCEIVGKLCLVIPQNKIEHILKPLDYDNIN